MITLLNNLKDLVENLDRKKLIIKLIPYIVAFVNDNVYHRGCGRFLGP